MGMVHGPNMVTDGLKFYLDAGNVRSYPGSGSTWYDLGDRDYNVTAVGSPTHSSNNGGYFAFDGTNDYFYTNSTPVSTWPAEIYSLHIWFRVDHTNAYENIYSQFMNNYRIGNPFIDMGSSGQMRIMEFRIQQNIASNTHYWYTANGIITADVWQCITVVRPSIGINDSNLNFYQNGQEVSLTATTGSFGTSWTRPTSIGGADGNPALIDIAIVCQYNKALSAEEVLHNYNAHKSRFGL